jgi:hypothetical protein
LGNYKKKWEFGFPGKQKVQLTTGFWKPRDYNTHSSIQSFNVQAGGSCNCTLSFFILRGIDYLINIYLTIVEVILFFNPFAG